MSRHAGDDADGGRRGLRRNALPSSSAAAGKANKGAVPDTALVTVGPSSSFERNVTR